MPLASFLRSGKYFQTSLRRGGERPVLTGHFECELGFLSVPCHPEEQVTITYRCIYCCQCSVDADAGTSPSEDDSTEAKKSLFEPALPTADATSGSDSEQVKVDATDEGTREDSGKLVVT